MKKSSNSGSSLVSVIVAFAILMMVLSLFTTAVFAASDISKKAGDLRRKTDAAMEDYFMESSGGSQLLSGDVIYFKDENGNGFSVDGNVMKQDGEFAIYYFEQR